MEKTYGILIKKVFIISPNRITMKKETIEKIIEELRFINRGEGILTEFWRELENTLREILKKY